MNIDIAIIRTKNLSARIIHIGMWLYCVLRFIKPQRTYNHAEVKLGFFTSGAIPKKVKTRPWKEYLAHYEDKFFRHIEYPVPLSEDEINKGLDYLNEVEGTPYEFENFWYHTIKIFKNVWRGSNTTRQLYCYEHVIRFLNATGKYDLDPFMNPYQFKVWADNNLRLE